MLNFSISMPGGVLLYLHKPLRFNSCIILLCSVGEYDNASMFIMICLACSKFVTGCVMMLLGEAGLQV